jgi:hypothetical protein
MNRQVAWVETVVKTPPMHGVGRIGLTSHCFTSKNQSLANCSASMRQIKQRRPADI